MTTNSLEADCFVPGCNNTKKKNPDKLFFNVPKNADRRKWEEAVGRTHQVSLVAQKWCCEDHFTLDQDVQEWMRYKICKEAGLPTFRLKLKPGAVPHISKCPLDGQGAPDVLPQNFALKRKAPALLRSTETSSVLEQLSNPGPTVEQPFEEPPDLEQPSNTQPEFLQSSNNPHVSEQSSNNPHVSEQSSNNPHVSEHSSNNPHVSEQSSSALPESEQPESEQSPHIQPRPEQSTATLNVSGVSSRFGNESGNASNIDNEFVQLDNPVIEFEQLSTLSIGTDHTLDLGHCSSNSVNTAGTDSAGPSSSTLSDGESFVTARSDVTTDSMSSVETYYKDASCQTLSFRKHFRSKAIQVEVPVTHCGVMTSPIKWNTGAGSRNFDECESEINDTLSTGTEAYDSSYHPEGSTVRDVSYVDSELKSFIQSQQLTQTMSLVESSPKTFLGIDPHYMFVITGLENFGSLSRTDIFICLWKLRKNESEGCLGLYFGKSKSTISRIFNHCFPILAHLFKTYITWPERDIIQSNVPLPFQANFSKVESIVDCFEVEIEKPSDATNQALTWSNYKKCNTMKFLVSCTPGGYINFISKAYGGRTSDIQIVKRSGFLDMLKENTLVMAERGFKELETSLNERSCTLIRPPSVASGVKMSKDEVRKTKQIASLRIHVERVIRRIREFEFLGPHACFNHHLLAYIDQAAIIACALSNLQSPIVH